MTKQEMLDFEKKLLDRGYKKWTSCLYSTESYDVSKVVKDKDGEGMYQIIFRFWDWTGYSKVVYNEASVDLVILPCLDGRADLVISSFYDFIQLDVDKMEALAKDYYEFITERLK